MHIEFGLHIVCMVENLNLTCINDVISVAWGMIYHSRLFLPLWFFIPDAFIYISLFNASLILFAFGPFIPGCSFLPVPSSPALLHLLSSIYFLSLYSNSFIPFSSIKWLIWLFFFPTKLLLSFLPSPFFFSSTYLLPPWPSLILGHFLLLRSWWLFF